MLQKSLLSQNEEQRRIAALEQQVTLHYFFIYIFDSSMHSKVIIDHTKKLRNFIGQLRCELPSHRP